MTQDYLERARQILKKIDKLAGYTDFPGIVSRTFGTDAFVAASVQMKLWMEDAGLDVYIDNIGNIRATLPSPTSGPLQKNFVIGSHIDSVINAGKFDGPLGILMGLDLLKNINDKNSPLPFNLHLIAFCDEEGVRFHTTYLGSKVVAGGYEEALLQTKDSEGSTIREVLEKLKLKPEQIQDDRLTEDGWLGYFEIHIEQGPVLYDSQIPVGLVTSIAGQRRVAVTFRGTAGHAGTVPMDKRQDALCCAAEFILEVEKLAFSNKKDIVATVGKLSIKDSASNVIPGEVNCTLDLRSSDPGILEEKYQEIFLITQKMAAKRNIVAEWIPVQKSNPLPFDETLSSLLASSIEENGYPLVKIPSGAGHDGVEISKVSPVSMLFVKCYKGISHHPSEHVEEEDIAAALKVSETFLSKIILKYLKN